MTLALAQIAHLGNARSRGPVVALGRAFANPYALLGVAIAVALQAIVVVVRPLAEILHVVPLGPTDWIVVVVLGSIPAVVGQVVKALRQRDVRLPSSPVGA